MTAERQATAGLTLAELQDISVREARATAGPWSWERIYEMPDENGEIQRHWALCGPCSVEGRIVVWPLVLLTASPASYDGLPLEMTRNLAFVASARADVPRLLAEVKRLNSLLEREVAE